MSKTHRLVLLTDIHLRSDYIPGFLDRQLDTLIRLVNRKPPDSVLINGDIFHRRNPEGDALLAFDYLLDNIKCNNIIVNRGNHDTIRKDDSTNTTLELFAGKAKIVKDTETVRIGSSNFTVIPHYEDEDRIIEYLKSTKEHVFGHFGFDGCLAHGNYTYESKVKPWHFPKKKLSFLGHIHKPRIYDKRIHVLGTQYSNSFGEANSQKYLTELYIRNGVVEFKRKPINFGIRHVSCTIDDLPKMASKLKFDDFFTMLRLKLDRLDEYVERQIYGKILKEYKIDYLEMSFEDILPKFASDYSPHAPIIINDGIINDYIDSRNSVFSRDELLGALNSIRDED